MNFDTSIKPPCPPKYPKGTKVGMTMSNEAPFGGLGALDRNGRPVGTSLDECFDELSLKLIEFYGESFRAKLNHDRAERGLKPL